MGVVIIFRVLAEEIRVEFGFFHLSSVNFDDLLLDAENICEGRRW
jgi:hypothetical protein